MAREPESHVPVAAGAGESHPWHQARHPGASLASSGRRTSAAGRDTHEAWLRPEPLSWDPVQALRRCPSRLGCVSKRGGRARSSSPEPLAPRAPPGLAESSCDLFLFMHHRRQSRAWLAKSSPSRHLHRSIVCRAGCLGSAEAPLRHVKTPGLRGRSEGSCGAGGPRGPLCFGDALCPCSRAMTPPLPLHRHWADPARSRGLHRVLNCFPVSLPLGDPLVP